MFVNDLIERKRKMIRMEANRYAAKHALIGAGIGAAVGVAVGMLVAPKAGKEIRQDIVKGAKHAVESAKEAVESIKSKFEKPEDAEPEA
jgi:gas vesicle protein